MPDLPAPIQAAHAALARHARAVEGWLKSSREERTLASREVEAAWREVKNLRADTIASHHSAALMRASGKLRTIA